MREFNTYNLYFILDAKMKIIYHLWIQVSLGQRDLNLIEPKSRKGNRSRALMHQNAFMLAFFVFVFFWISLIQIYLIGKNVSYQDADDHGDKLILF